jgi:3-oxoacyl-[acyl-carrier protein] reductase
MNDERSRTALVTGASTGIGRATALALGRAGYDLAVTDLDTKRLAELIADPELRGRKLLPIALELRSEQSVTQAIAQAVAALGTIDLLVNNAGRPLQQPATDVTWAEWNDVIDIKLKGAFFLSTRLYPALHRGQTRRRNRQHGIDPRHDRHRRPLGLRHLQGRHHPDDAQPC